MSAPLVPSPLDYVGRRKFSFYPPISNVDPNEWLLGTGSWSEVQVVNAETGLELWIPRQYVGGVSDGIGLRLIVELTKELDHVGGTVAPRVKRIIEIPHPEKAEVKPGKKRRRRGGPAPVVGIRLEGSAFSTDKLLHKALFFVIGVALVTALLAAIARL